MPVPPDGWLDVGVVVRPHGVRGLLRVCLHNADSAVAENPDPSTLSVWDIRGPMHRVRRIIALRTPFVSVACDGCTTREAAENLRNARLLIPRSAVLLAPNEYLYVDLIGCQVHEGSRFFGEVRHVFNAGSCDILVIGHGTEERLVPLVDDWVSAVDVVRRTIELRGGEQWDLEALG